ncbi:MAG TPA: zinc dependent phospholipase C family protein [Blastocatellia bacterium]|nr:zinc dependent phospholipase C family protein [Blastocatellia bacterium]
MNRRPFTKFLHIVVTSLIVLCLSQIAPGYSVLTHQSIIDSSWDNSIKPLLLKRYPQATAEQLRDAHAYAYGGAIIQDMGYYPFGSKFFTDLAHYVRSGDFLEVLISEAQELNEYAFAIGALAHYAADNNGHSIAVNRAVPILYPKLRVRYGDKVTYVEDPTAHLRTEFGFDVVQMARGRYASDAYRDFIGFKVSKPVLERAFKKTYGLEIKDVFTNIDLALGTYRRAVSTVIPEMTRVAWQTKKDEIEKNNPGITREKFLYRVSRAEYEKEYGNQYEKPGALAKTLAFLVRIVPKVGPLKTLSFKPPTPEAERMYLESVNATLELYRTLLGRADAGRLDLQNKDFDTGEATRAGEYKLADETYAKLVTKLADKQFEYVTADLRQNILSFFGDLNAPVFAKRDRDDWRKTLSALEKLKATPTQATKEPGK